jgi:hypothetical protein
MVLFVVAYLEVLPGLMEGIPTVSLAFLLQELQLSRQ